MSKMILFSHSGNMGDLLYSLYMVTELSEHLGMPAWLHLQTNVHFDYSYQTHPNGDVGFTQANVEFMRPLLETIPVIRKITFGDEIPPHDGVAVDLSKFRSIGLNLCASNIPRWYYNLVNPHLPQDFSRQLISVEPDYSLRDRIVVVHSTRYCSALLKLGGLAKYRDRLVFMGLKAEHEAFCSKWFDIEYCGVSNALEFARLLRGASGVISNQNGLYVIAELMKVPRVLLSYEYGMNNGHVMPGSPDALPVGGWYEFVQSPVKFDGAIANLMQHRMAGSLESHCNHGIDAWLNNTIFKDRKDGVYIECGANDGIRDSISWFYENHFNWSGILVEPLHEMMAKCKAVRSDRNIFVEKGLGDMNGEIEIEVPDDNLDNSSIVMSESHRQQLKSVGYGKSYHKEKIEMVSYASMIAKTGVKHVDLAIFDVEGYEDHILSSLVESDVLPEVMVVEHAWSDKDRLVNIVSGKYDVIKEFEYDMVFKLKDGLYSR